MLLVLSNALPGNVVGLSLPGLSRPFAAMLNAFTIDVEEYFHPSEVGTRLTSSDWSSLPSRVEIGTAYLLDLLATFDVRATFFILGWVASEHPKLVRRVAEAGHEIGCHSHKHRLVYELSPSEFKADTTAASGLFKTRVA